MRRIVAVIVVLVCSTTLTWASTGPTVSTTVKPRNTPFGTSVKLRLVLSVPSDVVLKPPSADSFSFGDWEVRDAVKTALPPENGCTRYSYIFRLAAYAPGKKTIPAVDFHYSSKGHHMTVSSRSEQVKLTGAKPRPGDKKDQIRDLKPADPMPLPPIVYLAGLLALTTLVCIVWWIVKSLRQRKLRESIPPPLPPHEWALAELARLEQADVEVTPFIWRLTEILRTYLARRFGIPVLERTTSELVAIMRDEDFPDELRRRVKGVLELADLVKFARREATRDQALEKLEQTRAMVRETAPRPESEQTTETEEGERERAVG